MKANNYKDKGHPPQNSSNRKLHRRIKTKL